MGLDATNKVLLRFKSACSATVTSWKVKISLEANSDMMLSKKANNKGADRPALVSAFAVRTLGPKDKFSCIEDLVLTPLHGIFFVLMAAKSIDRRVSFWARKTRIYVYERTSADGW